MCSNSRRHSNGGDGDAVAEGRDERKGGGARLNRIDVHWSGIETGGVERVHRRFGRSVDLI